MTIQKFEEIKKLQSKIVTTEQELRAFLNMKAFVGNNSANLYLRSGNHECKIPSTLVDNIMTHLELSYRNQLKVLNTEFKNM